MTDFNHGAFVTELRRRQGKVPEPLYSDLMAALDIALGRKPPVVGHSEPAWVVAGRSKIGEREIPGPKHNGWIASGWAKLGAGWFNDDETPWCGFFIAWCMQQAGLSYPLKGEFARAKAWASWGVPVSPMLGAIGVKSRSGGGHVFIIVGETADKRFFKALGGNQSDAVSIVDIAKSEVEAIRWPAGVPVSSGRALPVMPRGTISGREA